MKKIIESQIFVLSKTNKVSVPIQICYTNDDVEITSMIKNDQINNQTTINQSYLIDKIEGVDHTQTAKFTVYDYYILYEKNIETE